MLRFTHFLVSIFSSSENGVSVSNLTNMRYVGKVERWQIEEVDHSLSRSSDFSYTPISFSPVCTSGYTSFFCLFVFLCFCLFHQTTRFFSSLYLRIAIGKKSKENCPSIQVCIQYNIHWCIQFYFYTSGALWEMFTSHSFTSGLMHFGNHALWD